MPRNIRRRRTARRGGGLQFPGGVSQGLAGWYTFDNPSYLGIDTFNNPLPDSDGQPIGYVRDRSGNARDMVHDAGLGSTRPTYKKNIKNGLSVARFDGTDDRLIVVNSLGLGTSDPPFSIIVVALLSDNTPNRSYFGQSAAGNPLFQTGLTAGTMFQSVWRRDDAAAGFKQPSSTPDAASLSTFYVFSSLSNGTTLNIFRDGTQKGGANLDIDVGTLTNTNTFIGAWGTAPNDPWQGDIGEVLVYNRLLSSTERQNVERYLGTKWGITVA